MQSWNNINYWIVQLTATAYNFSHTAKFKMASDGVMFRNFPTPEKEIEFYIWIIGAAIVLPLGTIGSILSIVVFCRKEMRVLPSSLYFVVLAVSDLLMLYSGLTRYVIRALTDVDFRLKNEAICKTHIYLVYSLKYYCSWVLVAVAVERLISVWFPFKAKYICTRKNGAVGLSVLAIILFGFDLHFFWTHGFLFRNDSTHACTSRKKEFPHFFKIYPWIDSALYSYGPFLTMLVCNIMIIVKIMRAQVQRKRLTVTSLTAAPPRISSMTAMLLAVTFTYLLLSTPLSLFHTGQYFWWKDRLSDERFMLYWPVANILMYLNNSINFFLYILSGPKFRKELRGMFTCLFRSNRVMAEMPTRTVTS